MWLLNKASFFKKHSIVIIDLEVLQLLFLVGSMGPLSFYSVLWIITWAAILHEDLMQSGILVACYNYNTSCIAVKFCLGTTFESLCIEMFCWVYVHCTWSKQVKTEREFMWSFILYLLNLQNSTYFLPVLVLVKLESCFFSISVKTGNLQSWISRILHNWFMVWS